MDMNTNVMSTAPADATAVKPIGNKSSSGVQAKTSEKDRKNMATGKKADKFDAVLEKTRESKNDDADAEKNIPEGKAQLSTPLAAQLAAAISLQAEAPQNDVEFSPKESKGENVVETVATVQDEKTFPKAIAAALVKATASLTQLSGEIAQELLVKQNSPAKTEPDMTDNTQKTGTVNQPTQMTNLLQDVKATGPNPLSLAQTGAMNQAQLLQDTKTSVGTDLPAVKTMMAGVSLTDAKQKADDGKSVGTAAMSLATGNLSIESLLSQNKSSDNNPKTILELLNANTGAATQTNASVPIQAQAMAASLQAATGAIGQANSSVQNIVESVQPMMQQTLPVMQPKNASKADAKDLLDKSGKASSAAEKDNLFSLQDTSMSPLQGVPLKVENQTPMTPLQQQLQNMQQAAKPVDKASTVDAGVTLLKSDEPAKTNKETDDSQSTSQFMTQLTKASDINNTLGAEPAKPIVKDYEIPKQIVEQAKLIKTAENSQMVIKLSPEHLGEMVLKVSVSSNGSVNASFHSDNAEVRTIIENSLVQLRQELQSQGLKVDNVGVYAGLGDSLGQGSQANQQQQAGSQNRHRQVNMEDFEDEVSSIAPINTDVSTDDGIDYRI